uniref:hypothetical protein n=1 Tax=Flavobacterium micromati TaxID=229205 RepID=UPI001FCCCF83|nr:hypothetical protein [Flavobacterium micromati]
MGEILEKMDKKMLKRLSGIGVFLATIRAELIFDDKPTIQAGFIASDFTFRHKKQYKF